MIRGYDIDGVITAGVFPKKREDFIITGRSYLGFLQTVGMLKNKGILNAVYMNPVPSVEVTRENAGLFKALMIQVLGVQEFWEDDELQADIIKSKNPDIIIHIVR